MKCLSCIIALLFCSTVFSQNYTISGTVVEERTGEKLINAHIIIKEIKQVCVSNHYGYYSFELPKAQYTLVFSYVGYKTKEVKINLSANTVTNVELEVSELGAVEISGKRTPEFTDNMVMPIASIKLLPVIMGESDVLKSIQLMPGIQAGVEGSAGFYVRGSNKGNNLVLLDGIPIYNSGHAYGFFSVFNPNSLKHVKVIKGGFPARYGGRSGAVVDVRMREGSMRKVKVDANIGLIASGITFEAPLIKEKSSILFSYRRTYFDLLTPFFKKIGVLNNKFPVYYFYDLNAKIGLKLNKKNNLYLSVYNGNDDILSLDEETIDETEDSRYTINDKEKSGWGNTTTSLRWTNRINDNLFLNTTSAYSSYHYFFNKDYKNTTTTNQEVEQYLYTINYNSSIKDLVNRIDVEWIQQRHSISAGLGHTYHYINPGTKNFNLKDDYTKADTSSIFLEKQQEENDIFIYAEDRISYNKLKLNIGFHHALFGHNKLKHAFQPRISIEHNTNSWVKLKGSVSVMSQFLHQLSFSTLTLPTDIWVASTENIPPAQTVHYELGATINLSSKYSLSTACYYKKMDNLIRYKPGAALFSDQLRWDDKVTAEIGRAYGAELMLRKNSGKLTAWAAYTISKAERKVNEISNSWFPFRFDRTHDFSMAVNYKLKKSSINALWIFYSGNMVTMPESRYMAAIQIDTDRDSKVILSDELEYYSTPNNFRLKPFHRLDVSWQRNFKHNKFDSQLNIGIYNLYDRKNTTNASLSSAPVRAVRYEHLIPFLPYISFTIKI